MADLEQEQKIIDSIISKETSSSTSSVNLEDLSYNLPPVLSDSQLGALPSDSAITLPDTLALSDDQLEVAQSASIIELPESPLIELDDLNYIVPSTMPVLSEDQLGVLKNGSVITLPSNYSTNTLGIIYATLALAQPSRTSYFSLGTSGGKLVPFFGTQATTPVQSDDPITTAAISTLTTTVNSAAISGTLRGEPEMPMPYTSVGIKMGSSVTFKFTDNGNIPGAKVTDNLSSMAKTATEEIIPPPSPVGRRDLSKQLGWWDSLEKLCEDFMVEWDHAFGSAHKEFEDAWEAAKTEYEKEGSNWYNASNAWINRFVTPDVMIDRKVFQMNQMSNSQQQETLEPTSPDNIIKIVAPNLRSFYKAKSNDTSQLSAITDKVNGKVPLITGEGGAFPLIKVEDNFFKYLYTYIGTDSQTWTLPPAIARLNGLHRSVIAEANSEISPDKDLKGDNPLIQAILNAGPSHSKNMYTVSFVKQSTNEYIPTIGTDANLPDYITKVRNSDFDIFNARLEGINIPQMLNETFNIEFAGRQLTKVKSQYKENHVVDLTFELDQNAIIMQHLSLLSGQKTKVLGDTSVDYRTFLPGLYKDKNINNKIIVTYNDFNSTKKDFNFTNFTAGQSNNIHADLTKQSVIGKIESYRAWVFNNVQFLGFTNKLDFKRDSADRVTITAQFRYKRLTTINTEEIS